MTDAGQRKKIISLRLSEAEFVALKTQYRTHGARNPSDLARIAIQRIIDEPAAPENQPAAKLQELDARLNTLEALVSLILKPEKKLAS